MILEFFHESASSKPALSGEWGSTGQTVWVLGCSLGWYCLRGSPRPNPSVWPGPCPRRRDSLPSAPVRPRWGPTTRARGGGPSVLSSATINKAVLRHPSLSCQREGQGTGLPGRGDGEGGGESPALFTPVGDFRRGRTLGASGGPGCNLWPEEPCEGRRARDQVDGASIHGPNVPGDLLSIHDGDVAEEMLGSNSLSAWER